MPGLSQRILPDPRGGQVGQHRGTGGDALIWLGLGLELGLGSAIFANPVFTNIVSNSSNLQSKFITILKI